MTLPRLFAVVPAAALLLAGCGADTCTSAPAPLKNSSASPCTLAPGSSATVQVQLCGKCGDSSPSCNAEFVNGRLEVAPVVQQCANEAGCATSGCKIDVPSATCQISGVPSQAGSYPLLLVGDNQVSGTVTVQPGGSSSCTL